MEDNTLKAYFEQVEKEEPFKTWGKLYEIEEAIEEIGNQYLFEEGTQIGHVKLKDELKDEFNKIVKLYEHYLLYQEKADIYERNFGKQMNQQDYTRLLEIKKLLGER